MPVVLASALAVSCGTASPAGAGGEAASSVRASTASTGVSFVSGVGTSMQTCGNGGAAGGGGGSTGCEGLEGGVSYMNDVAHILANCQGEACHASPSRATTVGVPAYECCDGRPLIDPGNANQSYLLDKIEGRDLCLGARMPFNLPPLPASEILAIKRWVCEGAPDN